MNKEPKPTTTKKAPTKKAVAKKSTKKINDLNIFMNCFDGDINLFKFEIKLYKIATDYLELTNSKNIDTSFKYLFDKEPFEKNTVFSTEEIKKIDEYELNYNSTIDKMYTLLTKYSKTLKEKFDINVNQLMPRLHTRTKSAVSIWWKKRIVKRILKLLPFNYYDELDILFTIFDYSWIDFWEKITQKEKVRNSFVLSGPNGSGKTTLLKRIQRINSATTFYIEPNISGFNNAEKMRDSDFFKRLFSIIENQIKINDPDPQPKKDKYIKAFDKIFNVSFKRWNATIKNLNIKTDEENIDYEKFINFNLTEQTMFRLLLDFDEYEINSFFKNMSSGNTKFLMFDLIFNIIIQLKTKENELNIEKIDFSKIYILIDEIENSFHPSLLLSVNNKLLEIKKFGINFIIATHSVTFLKNFYSNKENMERFLLYKISISKNRKLCKIIDYSNIEKNSDFTKKWLDIVVHPTFLESIFYDKILLVEGKNDFEIWTKLFYIVDKFKDYKTKILIIQLNGAEALSDTLIDFIKNNETTDYLFLTDYDFHSPKIKTFEKYDNYSENIYNFMHVNLYAGKLLSKTKKNHLDKIYSNDYEKPKNKKDKLEAEIEKDKEMIMAQKPLKNQDYNINDLIDLMQKEQEYNKLKNIKTKCVLNIKYLINEKLENESNKKLTIKDDDFLKISTKNKSIINDILLKLMREK